MHKFIFDTGGYTVFSEALIGNIRGKKQLSFIDVKDGNSVTRRIETYQLEELSIGDVPFRNVGFAKIGFTEAEWFQCLGLSGTIGPNIMKEGLWLFDKEEQQFTLTNDRNRFSITAEGTKVPLHTDQVYKPSVDIQVNGHLRRAGFDTGFNGFLRLIDKGDSQSFEEDRVAVKLGSRNNAGNSTVYAETRVVKLDSVRLGELLFMDLISPMNHLASSDLIGSAVFDYYKVLIDLSGNALYLKEFRERPLAETTLLSFGLGFDYDGGKVVVGYVYAASNAHQQGLKSGQEILKVNGQHYEYATYCDFINEFTIPQKDSIELELQGEDGPYQVLLRKEKIL